MQWQRKTRNGTFLAGKISQQRGQDIATETAENDYCTHEDDFCMHVDDIYDYCNHVDNKLLFQVRIDDILPLQS